MTFTTISKLEYSVTVIALMMSFSALAQTEKKDDKKNYPFQVIYAEGVTNSKGVALTSLDFVHQSDRLTVNQKGFLSMVHFLGFPIEVEGDTIVNVRQVREAMTPVKLKPKEIKYRRRPNIDLLFSSNPNDRSKLFPPCHDCGTEMEVLYPPVIQGSFSSVYYRGDLCLSWETTTASKYVVSMSNIFGDRVKVDTVKEARWTIPAREMDEMMGNERVMLFESHDIASPSNSFPVVIEAYPESITEFPYPCAITKATYALTAAMYIESVRGKNDNEAEKFFRLAIQLSDRNFFKLMLENFLKRSAK